MDPIPPSHVEPTLEIIDDVHTFSRLAPEWEALLAESDADGLFLTWQWVFAWWKHLAEDNKLQIMTLRRGGLLVAIAPFALRPASVQHLPPVASLQFLGSGVAGSDYLDLIVRRGHEAEAVRVLSDRLNTSGRALALMRMRPVGPAAALVERMRQQRWHAWEGPREVCPWVSLRDQTFDTYMAGLGSEHRYAFRRKLAKLERRPGSSFELARTEEERERALSELYALHDRRWHSRGEPGAFSTPALRAFHDEVTRSALAAGWLRLWVLRVDGKPAAALYGFLRQRTFYFYQSGFDPAFARDSVGLVLLGVAVRAAMAEGADELDLLHGTERYKAHWTNAARELTRIELHAPGTLGFLEREATALTRKARRITRAALDISKRVTAKTVQTDHAAPR
ncbi:MAG TPA: GNAT family N-acetyltransferase [Polyangiaceae bacterium]|nr:GNAT family N-acetyltransferase [Polyangiaceae bacterium]